MSSDGMGSFTPLVDTAGYSTEKFYTRSRDTHGHDKLLRHGGGPKDVLAVPPELHAMFYDLKGTFPDYRTNADVMRDALVHLYHLRAEQMKNPGMAILMRLQRATAMVELERLEATVNADKSFMARVDMLYKEARSPGARTALECVIREYLVTCEDDEVRYDLEQLLRRL